MDWVVTGAPFFMLGVGGSLGGCCLFAYIAVSTGAVRAKYTTADDARRTGRRAVSWAAVVGLFIGIATMYMYGTGFVPSPIHWKHYIWVGLGSVSSGFCVASCVFRIFLVP